MLDSKQELQEHFRKHANGLIDGEGKPTSPQNRPHAGPSTSAGIQVARNVKARIARPTSCDVCDLVFDSVTLAIHHKYKQHPNCQKKYYCGFCGKQFPLAVCRESHMAAEHRGARPEGQQRYRCTQCHAEFFSVKAVTAHVNSTHRRVSTIISPVATLPPSKKIKMTINGEPSSVYYCHLCGMEYMVKFNLQKHLEQFHTAEERNTTAQEIIKCKLCDAMFYNQKAYTTHNFHHKPSDLYLGSELDRKFAIARVDQDFDISRIPTLLDKLEGKKKRIERLGPSTSEPIETKQELSAEPPTSDKAAPQRKNRALVESDSDAGSDSSAESEPEAEDSSPTKSAAAAGKRKRPTKSKKGSRTAS